MKLFVLTVCCVAVLATTSGDFKRKQELEKVLDELSNALTTAEEATTIEEGDKGNKAVGESTTKESSDSVKDRPVDSLSIATDDGDTSASSIKSHTGVNNGDEYEENSVTWLLDPQGFADGDEVVDADSNDYWDNLFNTDVEETNDNHFDADSNDDWENLFDTDVQEMNENHFDNEDPFEWDVQHAGDTASVSGDKAHAMSDDVHSEASKDDSTDHLSESKDYDQFADQFDKEVEKMSLDGKQFDAPDMNDDSETDDFLRMMKATDGKDSIDDNFKDFIDFIQSSDTDDASSEDDRLQMRDVEDFTKKMSEGGISGNTTEKEFRELLDVAESSDTDDVEEDSVFDSLPAFAQKESTPHPTMSTEDSLKAKKSDYEDITKAKSTEKSYKRTQKFEKHLHKPHHKAHKTDKTLWRILGHSFYYKKYLSTLMKYYRLRKRYYGLMSKCKKVEKACKKMAFKLIKQNKG